MRFFPLISFLHFFLFSLNGFSALKLTPQFVVDTLLKNSLEKVEINLKAEVSDLDLAKAKAPFDTTFFAEGNYTFNKAQSLTGFSNEKDELLTWKGSISKKSKTGSLFSLEYEKTTQKSDLGAFTPSQVSSRQVLNSVGFTFKQELLSNSFGLVDRSNIKFAKNNQLALKHKQEEELEKLILEAMELFWKAFVLKETLRESILSRERYERLVETVSRKTKVGYSKLGELPRVKAALLGQDKRVKLTSAAYLNKLDELFEKINISNEGDVEFEIPVLIPSLPPISLPNIENFRVFKEVDLKYRNSQILKKAAKFTNIPDLNLILKAFYVGLEDTHEKSISEMGNAQHPVYFIGFDFKKTFGSHIDSGYRAEAIRLNLLSENAVKKVKNRVKNAEKNAYRIASVNRSIARDSVEIVKLREEVVKSFDKGYKQGRVDIDLLIDAYTQLLNANVDKIQALGDYHISLNRLASIRDELISEVKRD
jgi:hypothetical protein